MKEIISTDDAPKAIGPYSQAVKVGNMIFSAGQVALNPSTGELNNANLKDEVNQIMSNLAAVAKAGGSDLSKAVKTVIFLANMDHFKEVNEIYGSYFKEQPPARSTVEVSKLPLGVNVEIEMIFYC